MTIVAGDNLQVQSQNNMDAAAIADGSAAEGKSDTAVGIAVAINVADATNTAQVGGTVTADATTIADMKDVGGDKTHDFAARRPPARAAPIPALRARSPSTCRRRRRTPR